MSLLSRVARWALGKSAVPFNRMGASTVSAVGESLRRPYAQSPWVMRAIKIIAGPIASVPIGFSAEGRRSRNRTDERLLTTFWENPAAGMRRGDFIEATVGWLKLTGNAYWIRDDSWLVPFATRSPLVLARPDRIRPVTAGSAIQYWNYTDGAGSQHRLLPEQVVHLKFWNPYDDLLGLAEMEAAAMAADADYLASKFSRDLMRNNGDAGAYLVARGGIPSDEQRDQIVRQLREKREAAARGVFKPMFLTGDITVEDPKIQTPDTAFAQNRIQNRHEIALAFGVPPSMFDIVASYSVGSASDRFRLIEDTCMPLAEKIADAVEEVSARLIGRRLFAWFDWDEHSVMQQVRRERIDAATKLFDRGMPWEKISDYLEMDLPEFEGWNIGYLPFGLAPVGQSADPATSADYGETTGNPPPETDPVEAMRRALQCPCHTGAAPAPAGITRDARRVALWRDHMARRAAGVAAFKSKFNRELMKARSHVLARLDAVGSGKSVTRASAIDFLFNLAEWKAGLLAAMRGVAQGSLQTAGGQLFKEIGKDDPFSMPPAKALQFIRSRENRLSDVADEVHAAIKNQLEEGLRNGEGIGALADRVRGEFNQMARGRATTIAMTETGAAYGFARDEAMRVAGVKFKQWLTSGNDNVREDHLAAEKQTVPFDEPFLVGEEELMYPGDPKGSPGNVINCHCVSIAVNEEEV